MTAADVDVQRARAYDSPHRLEERRSTVSRGPHRAVLPLLVLVVIGGLTTGRFAGQAGAKTGEWRTYGGGLGHTRYSPLDQVNADNFNKLEVAWRFKTDN